MSLPQVVSQDEWLIARKELLAKEKELTRQRDALNVLTFRGELISDVTAFIIRTPPESDDREVIARMPEQPTDPASLLAAFENFRVPDRLS